MLPFVMDEDESAETTDHPEVEDSSQTDRVPQPHIFSPVARREPVSEVPTETTAVGFGNRCGKPKGPRAPPSEWT
ncbi:UNVERIFIED_CONTAM: hypothetical protein K2H54_017003 [Gekko kuhli]